MAVLLIRWPLTRKECLTYFWTVLYFIIAPTVLLHAIPIYLFRFIISLLRPILRPDLARLVPTRSAVLARDDLTGKPTWNLCIWLNQDGVLDLQRFRQYFYVDHVTKRDSRGQLVYPEYRQYFEKWWGFMFWKWDKEFDINHHIRVYDGAYKYHKVVDEDILVQIIKEMTWKPWPKNKSPWEFLQIPNYQDKNSETKSILIYRIHHGLGDGYYILKLLMEDVCGVSLKTALGKPQYVKRSLFEKFVLGFLFWIRAPYQFVEMLVAADDVNKWHVPRDKMSTPMNGALTPCIPLKDIKFIKNKHNVSFTAVLTAAITGGIRTLMHAKKVPIPMEMHTAVAVPMPKHPLKLSNHFIFSFIEMPISPSEPLERLKKMDEIYTKLKGSTAPIVNFAKVPLVGSLPANWIKPVCTNRLSTCLISNFPGGSKLLHFKGVNVLDMMFNAGLGEGTCGLGFCMLSYLDHIRLFSEAVPAILKTDEEVKELNDKILEQLEIFKNM